MEGKEKPWMEMGDYAALSHDDWMWENCGLAEAIMEDRTRKPVRDIMEKWLKENGAETPEGPVEVEKLEDGGLKVHWHNDEDYAGLILKPEDFPLFEEAAYRKLRAVIKEYAEMHDYGDIE